MLNAHQECRKKKIRNREDGEEIRQILNIGRDNMVNDTLKIYSENQRHCYNYLNQLHDVVVGRSVWRKNFLGLPERVRSIPVYQGTCIKTHELEEGVYDIEYWFVLGFTNVTWHRGLQANTIW